MDSVQYSGQTPRFLGYVDVLHIAVCSANVWQTSQIRARILSL